MIRFPSATELKEAFRTIDRDEVEIPQDLNFPFAVKDYFAWVEPSGVRTYLLFEDPKTTDARGVVFKRTRVPSEPTAYMCQWCHRVSSGGAVGMLTAKVSANRRVGLHLCRDLSCKDTISSRPPSVNDLRESLTEHDKTLRLVNRISDFTRSSLF